MIKLKQSKTELNAPQGRVILKEDSENFMKKTIVC